jgi:hypothetical protein
MSGLLVLGYGELTDASARAVVRLTARTSLVLFCAAFAGSSIRAFWRTGWTRWLVVNRRYVGVSFATSHALHLVAVVAAAQLDPHRFFEIEQRTLANSVLALGAVGAFSLMALTSFDAAVRVLGPRLWRGLHWVCGYYVLAAFASAFGGRAVEDLAYAPAAGLVAATFLLRVAASVRAWSQRRSPAPLRA